MANHWRCSTRWSRWPACAPSWGIGDRAGHLGSCGDGEPEQDRCKKVAERVRCLKDILKAAQDGTTTAAAAAADAAATRRLLLDRLEEALGRALQVVRRCQRSCSRFLRSVIVVVVAGGRTRSTGWKPRSTGAFSTSPPSTLFALLASRHYSFASTPPYVAAASTEDSSEKDDENMRKKKGSAESVSSLTRRPTCRCPSAVVPT